MAVKTEKRQIDGLDVTVSQLPAMAGFRLFLRLLKLAGPALGVLFSEGGLKAASAQMLLTEGLSSLDEAEGEAVLLALLRDVTVVFEGKMLTLSDQQRVDIVFNGRMMAMLKVAAFSAEVNFKDFIDAAQQQAPAAAAPAENGSESTPSSPPTAPRRGLRMSSGARGAPR